MEIYNDTYCVYIHTNKINDKKYIGQTKQKPEKRWCNGDGYKQCPLFYKAIKKYGWDNFEHDIIASNLTKDEANNFEKLMIKLLKTCDIEFGYNLDFGGNNSPLMEETKRKIGNANKGHLVSEQLRNKLKECKSIPICQYSFDGELICEWKSATTAQSELNVDRSSIGKCCKGQIVSAGGFIWRYKDDPFYLKPYVKFKPVYQFSLNGDLIKRWDMLETASKELNIDRSGISACCNGKCKTFAGFVWSYDNNFVLSGRYKMNGLPVIQYLKDGTYTKLWNTLSEAANTLNIDSYAILRCCKGKSKKTHGYHWRFATEEEVSML